MVDVVAVADEGDDQAIQWPESLLEREHIREGLARMLPEGQPVDHRDVSLVRELLRDLVRSGPDDDGVDHSLEVAGDVANALPGAEDHVMGQVDRVAAQLGHAGLEAHPGAQARLLEEHRQRPTRERRPRVSPARPKLRLQPSRGLKDPPDFCRRKVSDAQQIPSDERRRGSSH